MNLPIRARWLERLRSGEYPQGRGKLCRLTADGTREYCCLGVLAELAAEDGIVAARVESSGGGVLYVGPGADREENYLPEAVVRWAGLAHVNPRVRVVDRALLNDTDGFGDARGLANLNDGRASFATIADLIEEQL